MKCVECKYIGNCKEKAKEPNLIGCTSGIPVEKMWIRTNADRIRAMTNEELAEFLANSNNFEPCKNCDYLFKDAMNERCNAPRGFICTKSYAEALIQEWLESEVETE